MLHALSLAPYTLYILANPSNSDPCITGSSIDLPKIPLCRVGQVFDNITNSLDERRKYYTRKVRICKRKHDKQQAVFSYSRTGRRAIGSLNHNASLRPGHVLAGYFLLPPPGQCLPPKPSDLARRRFPRFGEGPGFMHSESTRPAQPSYST